jgi:hypothetical protein
LPTELALGSAINQAVRQIGSVIGVGLVIALVGRTNGDLGGFVRIAQLLVVGGVLTSLICLGIKTGPQHRGVSIDAKKETANA